MKKILIYIFLLFPIVSLSQINKNGLPFLDNYPRDVYKAHSQNWAIAKDNRGVMYFGNSKGLLSYDGVNWSLFFNIRGRLVNSLDTDENGILYYGGIGNFGIILSDSVGNIKPLVLSDIYEKYDTTKVFSRVWKTYVIDKYVYFQSFEQIFRYKLPLDTSNLSKTKISKQFKVWSPKTQYHLSFKIGNKLYVRENNIGLKVLKNEKFELVTNGEYFKNHKIYFILPFGNSEILIGTREQGLFIYNTSNGTITPFSEDNKDFFVKSLVYNATVLPSGNFAIGTFLQGIIIVDKNGIIIEKLNKETGLPENAIWTMFCDYDNEVENNLWFTTGKNGIFKANISSPFRKFSKNNNLTGKVSSIIRYNGKIYTGTSDGVFLLNDTAKDYTKFELLFRLQKPVLLDFKLSNQKSKLISAGYQGVFEIINKKPQLISDKKRAIFLYQSTQNKNELFVGFEDGIGKIKYTEETDSWGSLELNKTIKAQVRNIAEDEKDRIWIGTSTGYIILKNFNDISPVFIGKKNGIKTQGFDFHLFTDSDSLILYTYYGFLKYQEKNKRVKEILKINLKDTLRIYNIKKYGDDYVMAIQFKEMKLNTVLFKKMNNKFEVEDSIFAKILGSKTDKAILLEKDYVWIANIKGLFKFKRNTVKNYNVKYKTLITNVTSKKEKLDYTLFGGYRIIKDENKYVLSNKQSNGHIPEIAYNRNYLKFSFAAPFYFEENHLKYSHRLIGDDDNWSKWKSDTQVQFSNLFEGEYTFQVKAKNIYDIESEVAEYKFIILPPWYRTIWAYISAVLILIFIIWLSVKLYSKKLLREKILLEELVEERTYEIRMKNVELEQSREEIITQRDEIELQKNHVEKQHKEIAEHQKHIMDSIRYARRIQEALLPPDDLLNELLPKHFVLFRPRDIVSGDFYWAAQKNNQVIIVAADCTGHGVPGAFMSMLGMSFLNEIVLSMDDLFANKILNKLRANIKRALRQEGKSDEAKDGMDLALCIIDFENMKAQYAGAYNPLYQIRDGEVIRHKADRMPIGIYIKEKESFTNNIVELKKDDMLYIFSDGYVDQFGGERSMKVRTANFKKVLLENVEKPMNEQHDSINQFFEDWMAHKDKKGKPHKQIDDVLVIGIKI